MQALSLVHTIQKSFVKMGKRSANIGAEDSMPNNVGSISWRRNANYLPSDRLCCRNIWQHKNHGRGVWQFLKEKRISDFEISENANEKSCVHAEPKKSTSFSLCSARVINNKIYYFGCTIAYSLTLESLLFYFLFVRNRKRGSWWHAVLFIFSRPRICILSHKHFRSSRTIRWCRSAQAKSHMAFIYSRKSVC